MRFAVITAVVLSAFFFTGCKKETYRTDLFYKAGARTFAFTVSITEGTLYISSMVDGRSIEGSHGSSVPEGKLLRAEAADLNSDGEPEVYAFYSKSDSWGSGLAAVCCGEKGCEPIGMEDSTDGHAPEGYCGEDAYSFEKQALVRQYSVCAPEGKRLGFIRYKLEKGSFGWVLRSRTDERAER